MDYKEIAKNFIESFYSSFNDQEERGNIGAFYNDATLLTNQDYEFMGKDDIMEFLTSERFNNFRKEIYNFSSMPAEKNILIQVQGDSYFEDEDANLGDDNNMKLPFAETFLIKFDEQSNSYLICCQIFSTQGI